MIVLRIILSVIFLTYLQLSVFLTSLICYPLLLLPNQGRGFIYFLARLLLRIIFFFCFIRVKVAGKDNIPKAERYMFVANMPTIFAPLYVIAALPQRVRFVVDPKMFNIFFLGRIMKSIGCIPAPTLKEDYFRFAYSSVKSEEPLFVFAPKEPLGESFKAKVVQLEISGSASDNPLLIAPGKIFLNLMQVLYGLLR